MPARSTGRDVDKGVRLSVVAADEAEALHRVEELDGAAGLLAGQLALGAAAVAAATTETAPPPGAAAILTRSAAPVTAIGSPSILRIGGRDAAAAIDQREFERLTFGKAGQAACSTAEMCTNTSSPPSSRTTEAEALLGIEELDRRPCPGRRPGGACRDHRRHRRRTHRRRRSRRHHHAAAEAAAAAAVAAATAA
jgi:hypothetical protein